jgi:hypothetical protein
MKRFDELTVVRRVRRVNVVRDHEKVVRRVKIYGQMPPPVNGPPFSMPPRRSASGQ